MNKVLTPAISPFDAQHDDEFLGMIAKTIEELGEHLRAGSRGPFAVPTAQFNAVKLNFERGPATGAVWKVRLLGVNPTLARFTIRASNEPEDTESEADALRPKADAFDELSPWLVKLGEAIKAEPEAVAGRPLIEVTLAVLNRIRNENGQLRLDSELLQRLRSAEIR